LCDIFAGTGVVGNYFNKKNVRIISNDFLYSNYVALRTFIGSTKIDFVKLKEKIDILNSLNPTRDNYFSLNFGGTYFTLENARKIGMIREKIEKISSNDDEKLALITSLIYAVDKVANTVGHYDAFRKKLDTVNPLVLLLPSIKLEDNFNNEIYCEDANKLVQKISSEVLYIDPPYNSRQYCDSYHLLENLARWDKPDVYGVARKMDRGQLKSDYCLRSAAKAFIKLIRDAKCKHILVSYNNTGDSKDGRSNSRIKDSEIVNILKRKGDVQIFERDYKAFTTGKSNGEGHTERIFYCKVTK
jgi:adenine-specific DNA-methyltransferase